MDMSHIICRMSCRPSCHMSHDTCHMSCYMIISVTCLHAYVDMCFRYLYLETGKLFIYRAPHKNDTRLYPPSYVIFLTGCHVTTNISSLVHLVIHSHKHKYELAFSTKSVHGIRSHLRLPHQVDDGGWWKVDDVSGGCQC